MASLLSACRFLLLAWVSATYATAAPQPNIVHILTDDLGWQDVACYYRAMHDGKEAVYETPNMDRIAAEGRIFIYESSN